MNIFQKVISSSLVALMCFSLVACGGETQSEQAQQKAVEDMATKELQQNDYRGGVKRTLALQEHVLNVMENMKSNNTLIRSNSPNTFWTAEGYQDFVSTFLDTPIINDTQWFNEEQTTWESVINQMASVPSSFTVSNDEEYAFKSGISVNRNEKDDYTIDGVQEILSTLNKTYSGTATYRILYDCDKDWCKTNVKMNVLESVPDITTQLFEYQRIDDNTFIIQTSKERLMIIFEGVENDTDIRERKIKEFYYSKLVLEGQRTSFEPYEELPETDMQGLILDQNIKTNEMMADYPDINEYGDFSIRYGENDSMFYRSPIEITRDWVFEDKSLQQAIMYKNGVLVATTYNKLSKLYERFVYALVEADDSVAKELEEIVEIENLVGIQISEVKVKNDTETEEIEEITEVPTNESEQTNTEG